MAKYNFVPREDGTLSQKQRKFMKDLLADLENCLDIACLQVTTFEAKRSRFANVDYHPNNHRGHFSIEIKITEDGLVTISGDFHEPEETLRIETKTPFKYRGIVKIYLRLCKDERKREAAIPDRILSALDAAIYNDILN